MNIPNFQNVQFVDRDGYLTDTWQLLMQQLFSQLQTNAGNEGLVAPSLNATQITAIQNHQNPDGSYSTQYGTMVFDTTSNVLLVAVDDGAGAPVFTSFALGDVLGLLI